MSRSYRIQITGQLGLSPISRTSFHRLVKLGQGSEPLVLPSGNSDRRKHCNEKSGSRLHQQSSGSQRIPVTYASLVWPFLHRAFSTSFIFLGLQLCLRSFQEGGAPRLRLSASWCRNSHWHSMSFTSDTKRVSDHRPKCSIHMQWNTSYICCSLKCFPENKVRLWSTKFTEVFQMGHKNVLKLTAHRTPQSVIAQDCTRIDIVPWPRALLETLAEPHHLTTVPLSL